MSYQLLILLLLTSSAWATTFKSQPLEQQLQEADGVMQGHYLKSKTIEIEDGRLARQMFFKMNRELGLQSELFGMDEVIIHYPGGSLKGRHMQVEGTPEFVPGEKVVLLIKSINNRYWGLNLGYGSYKIINYGKEVMLVNSLFPQDVNVGQMSMETFESKVREIKKNNLKAVYSEYPTSPDKELPGRLPASLSEEGKNRSIASKDISGENEEGRPQGSHFWLIAVLALLGGTFRLMRQKGQN